MVCTQQLMIIHCRTQKRIPVFTDSFIDIGEHEKKAGNQGSKTNSLSSSNTFCERVTLNRFNPHSFVRKITLSHTSKNFSSLKLLVLREPFRDKPGRFLSCFVIDISIIQNKTLRRKCCNKLLLGIYTNIVK